MYLKMTTAALAATTTVLIGAGCTPSGPELHSEPNVELIQDMMDQPALKAQDYENSDPTKASSRIPPTGTVAKGKPPYKYAGDADSAQRHLRNPLAGDFSPPVLAEGKRRFEIACAVCHGHKGLGDGPVAPKMALKPPSLMSDKIRTRPDGGIFHIITDGQGVMAKYVYQIPDDIDRWKVVNYIRSLQGIGSVPPLSGKK